ncbi:hypothetical protein, partial [Sagittula salina]
SAMALWLPLVAAAPLAWWLRALVLGLGAVVLVLLPGESAKLALGAGVLAGLGGALMQRRTASLLGAVLAVAIVVMPAV